MPRDPMSGQEIPERLPERPPTGTYPRYEPEHHPTEAPFAGLPQWARVIALVGIPGAIAMFTVWIGFSTLPKLEAELIAMRLEAERNRIAVQTQVTQQEQLYRLMQRICANGAKDDDARGRCFDR